MNNLSNFKHFVGCDVSKKTLDFAIYSSGSPCKCFTHICVTNDENGFKELFKWLRSQKVRPSNAVVAMEHTGFYAIALCEWLFKKKVTFTLLHPLSVKNYRSAADDKTDKLDAQLIADYLYTMREKLGPSKLESNAVQKLRSIRNERGIAVKARTAFKCLLATATDPDSIERIKAQIESLDEQIKSAESQIKEALALDEEVSTNYNLLMSVPGIGMINAVNTIVATNNFTRFETARQYAKFCCVSPTVHTSGSSVNPSGKARVSRAGHGELKADLTQAAKSAKTHYLEFNTYFQRKECQGKSYGCIMNAIKFKLICRMFAVVKRRQPYARIDNFGEIGNK